ncbi:unnamed protein product [Strongylus vulgaris]|uniref:C2H2-type domain-containing protein n=1 Tax=Strongylus vulgaris TaxID=40348 RepID=A0A3P7IIF0_STRVU|nr:unnamed protein product [Strongylus vulgaris]
MCEWDGCAALFVTASSVLSHVAKEHVVDDGEQACQWPGCDGTLRSRWSLVTHIQDHHANETALKMALQRRRFEILEPHLTFPFLFFLSQGWASSCATYPVQARTSARSTPSSWIQQACSHRGHKKTRIQLFAQRYHGIIVYDEPEGPVTKSIRLTSCLILRNLARYSATGRQ